MVLAFCQCNVNISFLSVGSAVNILLVTPEKAIKLTANDAFRYLLLDKQGYSLIVASCETNFI